MTVYHNISLSEAEPLSLLFVYIGIYNKMTSLLAYRNVECELSRPRYAVHNEGLHISLLK
jgi:phosphatidate phosphatase PAH1